MANQPGTSCTATCTPDPPQRQTAPKTQKVALPLHVQKLQGALNLDKLIDQVEKAFNDSLSPEKTVGYVLVGYVLVWD